MLNHKPYMGILVVNNYISDEPLAFYGSEMKSSNVTEIALHQAAQDSDTGEVVKQKLLHKIRLTDYQFGLLVGRPNFGDGGEVTQLFHHGYHTPEFTLAPEKKALVDDFNKLLEGGSGQVRGFIDEGIAIVNESIEEKRMTKAAMSRLQHLVAMMSNYVTNNEKFYASELSTHARQRVDEVKNSILRTISLARNELASPLLLENSQEADDLPTMSPRSFMYIGCGGSSSTPLFNEGNIYNGHVNVEFKSVKTQDGVDGAGPRHTSVTLSPSQYARFLRADQVEVTCTITRLNHQRVESVPEGSDPHVMDLTESHQAPEYREYADVARTLADGLAGGVYNGKKGRDKLLEDMMAASSLLDSYLEKTTSLKKEALSESFVRHQKDMLVFAEKQVAELPCIEKEAVKNVMRKMASQLVMLPNHNKE